VSKLMDVWTNSIILGVASEFWMTRWLTTFWLIGLGILIGLLTLAALVGIFYLLSKLPWAGRWSQSGFAFWSGLVGSVIMTVLAAWGARPWFTAESGLQSDEWLLFSLALWPILGIVSWAWAYCGQARFLSELGESLSRGVGGYLLGVLATVCLLGLLCTFLVDEPWPMLRGLPGVFRFGETTETFTVPPADESGRDGSFFPVPLRYDPRYIARIVIESDKRLLLADSPQIEQVSGTPVQLEARSELVWESQSSAPPPIPMVVGGNVFAQNLEIDPATIRFLIKTVPPYPETVSVYLIAAGVVILGLAWMLSMAAAPRLAAIAASAAKNELTQPLPMILMLLGTLLLVSFVHLPYNTQGEDIKLLKDCGLTLILIICLFQGVWSASSSVSDEIEGRTALTLMSKPVLRRSFILGKMLGIFWVLLLLVLFLGAILLLAVAYKPIVDARETQNDMPLWQACHMETMHTLPGLLMVLLQATTLSTLAVALATRVPPLANFAICFTIYLIGHLTPAIVDSTADAFPIIQFVAQLTAVLVPTLDWFSMDKAIDSGQGVPVVYLSALFLYSILYTAIAVFLGLLLFEDRDLA
jgi:ABC-type transport system involved in multi-copper enzyme maturation permease subunit